MAQQISVDITLGKDPISPFSQLSLRQQFNAHHYFELHFNHAVIEKAPGAISLDTSKKYLGETINISFNDITKSKTANAFKGIVTDIRISNTQELIFSGYSSTVLLETNETNLSYLDKQLSQIVTTTFTGVAPNELARTISPVKKTNIPYCVQYRESNFTFLRRLAAEYGEHFFYDGSSLFFGKPSQPPAPEQTLVYPKNISSLNLRVGIAPMSQEHIGFLSKENQNLKKNTKSQSVTGLDAFGDAAVAASDKLFKFKTNNLTNRKFLAEGDLDESLKVVKSKTAASLVVLEASSDSPFVRLGADVDIKVLVATDTTTASPKITEKDYGKYTVISVQHHTDGLGNYSNHFEAIPATIAVVPNSFNSKQIAEPQMGIVTSVKDPDKLGKVKVQLLWQKGDETTPFIRVLSPHSGVYADGKTTRGHFFTPEVNEMVIVGFAQNDPERPFVMGSLPHGKAIAGNPDENNVTKSISTRSGNIITFTDKEKDNEQEIKIQTDDTNYISIQFKNNDGLVAIYSSKAIEVNSKETIVVKSGKSIEVQGDKTISIKSEKITIEATDSISMSANKKIEIKAADVSIEASDGLEAKGGATVKLEGVQTEISGSGTAKLTGAMVNVEASGINTIKGSMVMIN